MNFWANWGAGAWALIGGFVGFVAGLLTIWQFLSPLFEFKISWTRIAKNAQTILKAMRRDNYRPDVIVSAGRAGGILAALTSGNYDGKKIPLLGVDMAYQWDGASRTEQILFPNLNLTNKKVLITVGEVHTGKTLAALVKVCKDSGATEIKTAALFHSEIESFKPDYYGTTLTKQTRMPWHAIENYEKSSFPKAA